MRARSWGRGSPHAGCACLQGAGPGARATTGPPPRAGSLHELAVAGASGPEAPAALAALLRAVAAGAGPLKLLDVRGVPLAGDALDALCELLAAQRVPLATLRADVACKEGAERIAQVGAAAPAAAAAAGRWLAARAARSPHAPPTRPHAPPRHRSCPATRRS